MKHLLLIALTIITANVQAQHLKPKRAAKFNTTKAIDSASLKGGGKLYIYQDRSDKVMFMGQFCLVNAELGKGDFFKWGFGASADVFLKKYVSLHAEYSHAYLDLLKIYSRNDNQTNLNTADVRGFSNLEGGIRVCIKDQKTKRKHKIILESHSRGRTTTEYYIKPMMPCRKMLAIRAGYMTYNTIATTDMASDKTVLAKDGAVLTNTYFTNAHSNGAYLGIANIVIFSAVTKNTYKKGSVYLSKSINELYADILFANTTFDPMVDSTGSHSIVANDPGSFKTSPIGARIGYKKSSENRGIMSYKVELGYRPGVAGQGFYFNMGVSLALIK